MVLSCRTAPSIVFANTNKHNNPNVNKAYMPDLIKKNIGINKTLYFLLLNFLATKFFYRKRPTITRGHISFSVEESSERV